MSQILKRVGQRHVQNERFLCRLTTWNETSITVPNFVVSEKTAPGTPKVSFSEASDMTKRLKTQDLPSEHTTDELFVQVW